MTTYKPFANNTLNVYVYENFSYTITTPSGFSNPTVVPSPGLPSNYFSNTTSNTKFSTDVLSNNLTAGTTENFVITAYDVCSNTVTSSNSVLIGAGRFLDPSGVTLSNNSYLYYAREPITPVGLVAPFAITIPTSVPTLPPGLTFTSNLSNRYDITGTPLVTVPQSNYLIIGRESAGGRIITTNIKINVSGERILLNVSGTPIIPMTIGTAIAPVVITARFPPYPTTPGNLQYSLPGLPDGIVATDISGNVFNNIFSGFSATDPSCTVIIQGTPTSNAAYAFANANISNTTVALNAQRLNPLPAITNSVNLTFNFVQTVLFDLSTLPVLYTDISVNSNANFFRARTFFNSGTSMASMFSPDLGFDLSLSFVPSSGTVYLTGKPNAVGSGNFTITATNSNFVTRDYITPITVQTDTAAFVSPTPALDACYNFILSRPLENLKAGYYSSNIQFKAVAASGLPVTLSAPGLAGTGLSLDSNGIIVGTPTSTNALTTLTVTATVSNSTATATRDISFAVVNDQFTFGTVASSNFQFAQNRAIVPFQIPVTTLSGRPIIDYAQNGLPDGLDISPAGVISGTPTSTDLSGTVTVIPTTGYVSGSNTYNFTSVLDSIFFFVTPPIYSVVAGDPVSIQITAVSSTGSTPSNYTQTLDPIYGVTVNSTTGLVSGNITNSLPPNPVLPPLINYVYSASVGALTVSGNASLVTYNALVHREFMTYHNDITSGGSSTGYLTVLSSDDYGASWTPTQPEFSNYSNVVISDFKKREGTYPNKAYIGVAAKNDGTLQAIRSDDGRSFSGITIEPTFISDVHFGNLAVSGTTWYTAGTNSNGTPVGVLYRSVDDGINWSPLNIYSGAGGTGPLFVPRNRLGGSADTNTYLQGGLTVGIKSGVLFLGGATLATGLQPKVTIYRSTNSGTTWTATLNSFQSETAAFLTDPNPSNQIIAVGSSLYDSTTPSNVYIGPAETIRRSTTGVLWLSTAGAMDVIAYDVKYGCNAFIAVGLDSAAFTPTIQYSPNGASWSTINLGQAIFTTGAFITPPYFPIGPVVYTGSNWNVYAKVDVSGGNFEYRMFVHDTSTSLASNWSVVSPSNSYFSDQTSAITGVSAPAYIQLSPYGSISNSFIYSSIPNNGPTFTSPTNTSYVFYQYLPITPIAVAATSSVPPISYFFQGGLPDGLDYSPVTGLITGTPSSLGYREATIYATDSNGYSVLKLSTNTIVPRIVRQQDGAGAYTSLLRQYTAVLGAQNARDNRQLPTQERALGEFMSPDAPDVTTQTIDPRCKNPEC